MCVFFVVEEEYTNRKNKNRIYDIYNFTGWNIIIFY